MSKPLQRILEIDTAWTERAAHLVNLRVVRWTATVLAHSGDSILWLAAGVLMWRFGSGLWARVGERIVIITAIGWLCTTLLKLFIQRPRPEGEQKLFYLDIDANSFPSGHAVRVGGLVVALSTLLPVWGALLLALWALSVCASRFVLGLHYVSDVTAGFLIGAVAGMLLVNW
jgi:membrane-associated phospholipid phosphatase